MYSSRDLFSNSKPFHDQTSGSEGNAGRWTGSSLIEDGSGWALPHDLRKCHHFSASAETIESGRDCWDVPRRPHSREML